MPKTYLVAAQRVVVTKTELLFASFNNHCNIFVISYKNVDIQHGKQHTKMEFEACNWLVIDCYVFDTGLVKINAKQVNVC